MSKKVHEEVNGKPTVILIESLDQLRKMVETPIIARFTLDGQQIEVMCRRLTPREEEEIRSIEREHQPPPIKDSTGRLIDYDLRNTAFLAKAEAALKTARAVALYNACPAIGAGKPGLLNRADITNYVQGLLTENILQLIYLTITVGGLEVPERVNFSSTPGSVQS